MTHRGEFMTKKNKLDIRGFSLVEITVVVAILIVLLAVLTPSLLRYTENSRMQKDESAMDELCNAIKLAMADSIIFDEVCSYAIPNNYITYTDSSGIYASKFTDEEFWAPDGSGHAVTITFNPDGDGVYTVAQGIVNDMTYGNGSVADSRTAEGLKQCYFNEMGDAKLYHKVEQTIGATFADKSATYKNSSYTVFITFEVVDGIKRADIYGEWNGTNLDPSCPASLGSGTSEYTEENEPIATKPNGGTTTPSFDNSDLSGGGSTSGDTPPANTPGSCGIAGHYDGDGRGVHGVPVDRCANNHTYTCECIPIPAGATYTTNLVYTEDEEFGDTTIDSSNAIVYREGDCFPTPTLGDIYNFGDYSYGYQVSPGGWFSDWSLSSRIDGWCAKVNDTTKTSYETPLSHINFVPLTAIESTYHNCSNLIHAPEIPSTVTNMNGAYTYCTKLQTAPVIHNGITDTSFAFYDCENLKVAPVVPETVTEIWAMFSGASQLETYEGNRDAVGDFSNYKIPRGVTDVSSLFSGCQKITAAPLNGAAVVFFG